MDNLRCGRQCEIINRPSYIVLFKGDDSDFECNQSVDIVINTELDTTGMKAHFRFMDFVQDFDSIPENKTLSLVFPNAKTSEFPLGAADATLRFEDASGKFRTISNRIHIVVTNSVHEAYENEDSQSITVTVKGTVTWEMIEGRPTFAPVATSGSYNDLEDKPTIPAPVTVDSAFSQTSENPVQNKVVTKALYTGFTEWEFSDVPQGYSVNSIWFETQTPYGARWAVSYNESFTVSMSDQTSRDATELTFEEHGGSQFVGMTATRHLITPTKTSQLVNDGPSSGPNVGHQFATTNQIPSPVDISGKLDGAAAYLMWSSAGSPYAKNVVVFRDGYLFRSLIDNNSSTPDDTSVDWDMVTLDELKQDALTFDNSPTQNSNNPVKSGGVYAALQAKASLTDLPYALVAPGEWEFSGLPSGWEITDISYELGDWRLYYSVEGEPDSISTQGAEDALTLTFAYSNEVQITATRASLPGHLLDRAGNRVEVTDDTTLTLPALVNAGRLRDFLVRLEISGSTVPTITFAAPTGETITYETDGDEFPVPDEAGTWLYSFTESCVAHKFAVSLKKVNVVTQGGS